MQDESNDPRPRAATYRRVSTGKQAEGGTSLPEQERETRQRCNVESWPVVADYADEGVSAGKERPALERMLADAAAGAFDVLVVRDLDRVGRSLIDLHRIVTALKDAGVRIVTLRGQSIDVETAEGRLQFNVLASVAEYERQKIAERVSGTAAARAAEGYFPGGRFRPYGYRREPLPDKKRCRLVIVPEEAEVVRRIYDETLAGRKQREIVKRLNADGIRTAQGKLWPRVTVQRILRSHVYAGMVEVKGEVHPGKHDAIVTAEQWSRVQTLIGAKQARSSKGRGRPPKGSHIFIDGVLHCVCGEPMRPRTYKGGRGSYCCSGAEEHGSECTFGPVPREVIDEPFLAAFRDRYLDVEGTRRALAEDAERDRVLTRDTRVAAERQLAKVEAELQKAKTDYRRGGLTAEDYTELRTEIADEVAAAKAQVRQSKTHEADVAKRLDNLDVEETVLREIADLHNTAARQIRDAATLAAVRAAVLAIFDHVDLGYSRVYRAGEGFVPWTPDAWPATVDRHDAVLFDAPDEPELATAIHVDGPLTLMLYPRVESFERTAEGYDVRRAALRLDPTMDRSG